MRRYVYDAQFIPDDDVIFVMFHDLPGCNTQGRNPEHAAEMAKEALNNWLDTLEYNGKVFPEPSVRNDGAEYINIVAELPDKELTIAEYYVNPLRHSIT